MSTRFVDTSALLAFLDRSDAHHARAAAALTDEAVDLVTHRYVEVETLALVHARLGIDAVRALVDRVLPAIDVHPVDDDLHAAARDQLVSSSRTRVSFVDWTSLLFMEATGLDAAIAFDRDFERRGFTLEP